MDWSNERYVRLYTRDTTTWRLLSWEGQALLPMLLRLVDRAGVLDLGGVSAVDAVSAALPKWPVEVVGAALDSLLQRGVIEVAGDFLSMPNFLEAQEVTQSDAQRKRDSRDRRRALARHGVTNCPETGPPVTKRDRSSQEVTRSHEQSHAVTLNQALPNQTELSQAELNQAEDKARARVVEPGTPVQSSSSSFRADEISADPERYDRARESGPRPTLTAWDRHREAVDELCSRTRLSYPDNRRSMLPDRLSVGSGRHGSETLANFERAVSEHGIERVLEILEVTLRACAVGFEGLTPGKVACMFRGAGWGAAVNLWERKMHGAAKPRGQPKRSKAGRTLHSHGYENGDVDY